MGLSWVYTVVAVAVAGLAVGGGHDFPAADLVVQLPGQPEVSFRQYAGYVDVDDGKNLFYYFVEAEENPDEKPLTLWLNGGPGCSSIGGGAFMELGPFTPTSDGRGLRINSKSWNKVSNLLFVESPVGVGWSYSNTSSNYSTNDTSTANDMFIFMFEWFNKFPTFRNRELFLAGESYAGHYIPQLAMALLYHNEHAPDPFNLKGIALGNPLLKVDHDVPAVYEYWWSHGLISDEIKHTITNECDFKSYSFVGKKHNVSKYCNIAIDEANRMVGNCTDPYGILYDVTQTSLGVDVCKLTEIGLYLNLPEVQKALHANRTNLSYPWSDCNEVGGTSNYDKRDADIDMLPSLKEILKRSIRVLIYSGDQDSVVPLLGSRTLVRELARDMRFEITVPYGRWYLDGQVGGWATEYGKLLTFATVRGAAHMVPYAQPSRALQLFTSFLRDHIAKHEVV